MSSDNQKSKLKSEYLEVFDTIDQGIVYQASDGQITNANQAAQDILGLTLDQMQGRDSMHPEWKSIHEDGSDYPGSSHPAMVALETGEVIKNKIMGVYHPEKDQHVWIKVNSYPLFDEDKKTASGVYTTFTNITAEYNSTKALEESESKFRVLFDNAYQFIGLMGPDGTMLDANKTGLQFLGVEREAAIGAKLWETPEYALTEKIQKKIQNAVAMAAKGQFIRFDFNLKGIDGTKITLDFSLRPVMDENNNVILLIPEGRDITKRVRLEKALQMEKELNAMQAHFAMSASHQFRTPLTIIQSNTELLSLLKTNLDPELQEKFELYTERITNQVKHTVGLMDDILLLGKITSGAISPTYEVFDVQAFLESLITDLNNTTEKNRIRFKATGKIVSIPLDQKLLTEALNNLISNALKYSTEDVNVELKFEATHMTICVQDFGIGIEKSDRDKLFQPFFRSQEVRDFSGTGLGLAIAKEYIEVQGGTINFKSSKEEGTEFIIQFKYPS